MIRTAARRIPDIDSWLKWLVSQLGAWRPIAQQPRSMIAASVGV
jgi:hypothetical protein